MANRVVPQAGSAGERRRQPGEIRPGTGMRVTLRRSLIGRTDDQRRTAHALGLRRIGASRVHAPTPSLLGAVRKIRHLVSVEEVEHGRAG